LEKLSGRQQAWAIVKIVLSVFEETHVKSVRVAHLRVNLGTNDLPNIK
jgi:hypothetical protein